jgi:hypothetical protein
LASGFGCQQRFGMWSSLILGLRGGIVPGAGAVLYRSNGCITLHAVGAHNPAPECLMHEALPR